MRFHLIYARSGMGRIFYVNQALHLTAEQLQAKVDNVIPPALQVKQRIVCGDGWAQSMRLFTSDDPNSQATVIAIEV